MEIQNNGTQNPLLIISAAEVATWLRTKADEAGFADRELCSVQITVEQPFTGGWRYHHECPVLVAMVSNIKNSRKLPGQ